MSSPAVADPDLPGGGGSEECASGESHGYYLDIHQCRSGGELYYRLILGDNIEFDIHPTRILLRHGDVRMEVRSDKIITQAPLLEHTGNINVIGNIDVTGDVTAGPENISLINHRHPYGGWSEDGAYDAKTSKPQST